MMLDSISAAQGETNKLLEQGLEIYRQLVTEPQLNKLPERLFTRNFLPFFCGERDPVKEPDFYVLWISIAGSPMSEVQIIDDNGNPLFTVPALNDTSIIKPDRNTSGSINFSQIITMAKMYGNMTPVAGQNVLMSGLGEKYKELQSKSEVFDSNTERWYQILLRYGKVEKLINTTTGTASEKPGALSDDDFEF